MGKWTPFDPDWYQIAFDQYTSVAEDLFNSRLIEQQGYQLPDADKSRDSIFRKDAVLNNSFNEKALRETLKDIYLHSVGKMTAMNHDNVQFSQQHFKLQEVKVEEGYAYLTIPVDVRYGMHCDWSKDDVLFFKGWYGILFINGKPYPYEVKLDEMESVIRFPVMDYWVDWNWTVDWYQFPTKHAYRVKVAQYQMNEWEWKVPVSYVGDLGEKCVIYFNRSKEDRTDGLDDSVELLGEALEFVKVVDGYLDLSEISQASKIYLQTERVEYVDMTVLEIRFLHEYPNVLPVDVIYQPYVADLRRVVVKENSLIQGTKVGNNANVYVDLNGHIQNGDGNWREMIRPIVLSDAYELKENNPYVGYEEELAQLRTMSIHCQDLVEAFRKYVKKALLDDEFYTILDEMEKAFEEMHQYHNQWLVDHSIEYDGGYDETYAQFGNCIRDLREHGLESDWLIDRAYSDQNVWHVTSALVTGSRELSDRFAVARLIRQIGKRCNMMEDVVEGIRFNRPIDVSDFWMFAYDFTDNVWRPSPVTLKHHFPDVYTIEGEIQKDRVYKAFLFYSDTRDVEHPVIQKVDPVVDWESNMRSYLYDRGGEYRDIFYEKFYWAGIREIYKGLLKTGNRWEAIEYVMGNPSYESFNQLFLESVEPYFKLGLATYFRSDHMGFPFDDAIAKMQEAESLEWNGYQKLSNYELYLNKSWIPSYYDTLINIHDTWDPEERLIRRPKSTFDAERLLTRLSDAANDVETEVNTLREDLDWILDKLKTYSYALDQDDIRELREFVVLVSDNLNYVVQYIIHLDLEIYSIKDIAEIVRVIWKHQSLISSIKSMMGGIYSDCILNEKWPEKMDIYGKINSIILDNIPEHIDRICRLVNVFDMDEFMRMLNDLRSYEEHDKYNPNDHSLLGMVNEFQEHWTDEVKAVRNNLFSDSIRLWHMWDVNKPYSREELGTLFDTVDAVRHGVDNLEIAIQKSGYPISKTLAAQFDYVKQLIGTLYGSVEQFMHERDLLDASIHKIQSWVEVIDKSALSETELQWIQNMGFTMERIVAALSYVAGSNHRNEAIEAFDDLKGILLQWKIYLDVEQQVFERIKKCTGIPNQFLEGIDPHDVILRGIGEYLETMDQPYEPDTKWPTYCDVYDVQDWHVSTGGYFNKPEELLFTPGVGVIQIDRIIGDLEKVDQASLGSFRTTTWRDPYRKTPYDTISNGHGFGAMIKVDSSNHQPILNDQIVSTYLQRIQSVIIRLRRDLKNPNPRNNEAMEETLEEIQSIQTGYNKIYSVYQDHMSESMKDWMKKVLIRLDACKNPVITFNGKREEIDLDQLLSYAREYIMEQRSEENPLISIMENAYQELYEFASYSSWDDGDTCLELINRLRGAIGTTSHQGFYVLSTVIRNRLTMDPTDNLVYWSGLVEEEIQHLEAILQEQPSVIRDTWYRFTNISVALGGTGYTVGDIVELYPELPVDEFGRPIHDIEEMILNDRILLQIKRVDDGVVQEVTPLLEYALPYKIWGTRDCKTVIGNGQSLKLNCYTYQVGLSDCTLLMDENSYQKALPKYSDADLIAFSFENIFDLDVGYEIFLGGKQIKNYFLRHIDGEKQVDLKELIDCIDEYQNTLQEALTPRGYGNLLTPHIPLLQKHRSQLLLFTYTDQRRSDLERIESILKELDETVGSLKNQVDKVNLGISGKDVLVSYTELSSLMLDNYSIIHNIFHPKKIDRIYLNANEVMALQDSSIYVKGDHYFIYRMDEIEIVHPGRGYHTGQTIVVGLDQFPLQLRVDAVDDQRRITAVSLLTDQIHVDGDNPSKEGVFAIEDPMINIDDEFHDPNRNESYMRPSIETKLPLGDPDHGYLAGTRVDIHEDQLYEGIFQLIPEMDGIISEDVRIPPNQPTYTEFQFLKRERLHASREEDSAVQLAPIDVDRLTQIIDGDVHPTKPLMIDGKELKPIPPETIIDGTLDSSPSGTIITPRELIQPTLRTRQVLLGEVEPIPSDSGYIYNELHRSKDLHHRFSHTVLNLPMQRGDLEVETFQDLPRNLKDWPSGCIGASVVVKKDETHDGHRMLYVIRSFIISGFFVYDLPEEADLEWRAFHVDWAKDNFYPDLPSIQGKFPSEKWKINPTYSSVLRDVLDGRIPQKANPDTTPGTYIHEVTVDDLSVFNWSTKQWEDLTDSSRWKLEVDGTGFQLICLEEGLWSYDMALYLNKKPENQKRNASLKETAVFNIQGTIVGEVEQAPINTKIHTGRDVRIRRILPFHYQQSFTIGRSDHLLGYEMQVTLPKYIHAKPELHLEDVRIYNKTTQCYEDILDTGRFEVKFRDPVATDVGSETQTRINSTYIIRGGNGFNDGFVWAYNPEYETHVYGEVKTEDGRVIMFYPHHWVNPPDRTISLEFSAYQYDHQTDRDACVMLLEFITEKTTVVGDGWIHNVTNSLAPLPKQFAIVLKPNIDMELEYEIQIHKSFEEWMFVEDQWLMLPTFHLKQSIPSDRIYLWTEAGRLPLVNPSTGKPSLEIIQTESGTDVRYMGLYRKYERMEVHSVPYPMRSVYTQRRVPKNGYIDLKGKLNKPLSHQYHEFWMNGRLLQDEVTIITPTKLFLHGLKSLRNFEIIEINRDHDEYFADAFIQIEQDKYDRAYLRHDLNTYLDDALSGKLGYDLAVQEALLTPVWRQVEADHPEFQNYPPNTDEEKDILVRIEADDLPSLKLENPLYQYLITDPPTIEGVPLDSRYTRWDSLGFKPISDQQLVDMMNEEWEEEISKGLLGSMEIVTDDDWYGIVCVLYDKYGNRTHSLKDAAYHIACPDLIRINPITGKHTIVRKKIGNSK